MVSGRGDRGLFEAYCSLEKIVRFHLQQKN